MPQQSDELRLLRHIADLRFEEELRGYSKSQVDRVLQKLAPLADDYEELHRKLAQAETRAASAEARLLERGGSEQDVTASDAPAVVQVAPAPEPAPVAAATPAPAVPETPADFDETLRKTLLLAQRTADETVKEAYDEADRITNNAHSEADLVLGKARTEAERVTTETEQRRIELQTELDDERQNRVLQIETETESRRVQLETALADAEGSERAELLEQIANLQVVRATLASDIESLEGHLAVRRETIQSALDEVATVLEEPGRLRSDGTPPLAEVAPVHAGDYADVGIDVEAHIADAPEAPEASETSVEASEVAAAVNSPETTDTNDETQGFTSEVVGEMQTDDGQVDVVVERDSNEELPDLPQRRKVADEDESAMAASPQSEVGDEADEQDADSSDQLTFDSDDAPVELSEADLDTAAIDTDAVDTDAIDTDAIETDFIDEEVDSPVEVEDVDDSPMVSISEAIPSIDPVGPAPDAAGPPTQEFSFADVEVPDADESVDGPSAITPPLPPTAGAEPALSVDGWDQTDSEGSGDVGQRPGWMDAVPDGIDDGPPPPPPSASNSQDPFLDQLRKATSEEPADSDEALDKFLDGDQDDAERRPWFGRRR